MIGRLIREYIGRQREIVLPSDFHDIREQAAKLVATRDDVRKKVGHSRPWLNVTGICLHQTACVLGERPGRWASLGAHIGITRAGKVIWVHDFDQIIYHAQGWNNGTIGIEIDGAYAGVEGDDKTFWRPADEPDRKPQRLTPETIAATNATIKWICRMVQAQGGVIKALVAHRQSSGTRRADPGSAIWQAVALPMRAELGLGDGGKGFKLGKGRPIPAAWDPSRDGVAY